MRLLRPLPLLLLAVLVAGCTSDDPAAPEAFRPPPSGPLQAGPCSLVADDVVDLGRLTYDLRGVRDPAPADRDRLLGAQERVDAVTETAPAPVAPALRTLVTRTGAVRIQADTRMLDDSTLDALRASYTDAVAACSAGGAATPTATTG
ncbi:MAG: hypothetical protein JWO60_1857, partial [Frankiales bacterium]|nr:hypothetical protein [Frankiales bacterium]